MFKCYFYLDNEQGRKAGLDGEHDPGVDYIECWENVIPGKHDFIRLRNGRGYKWFRITFVAWILPGVASIFLIPSKP